MTNDEIITYVTQRVAEGGWSSIRNLVEHISIEDLKDIYEINDEDIDTEEENPILKTSCEWQNLFPLPKVMDPDGWDRTNYHYSWYQEEITYEEYVRRLMQSTCLNKSR